MDFHPYTAQTTKSCEDSKCVIARLFILTSICHHIVQHTSLPYLYSQTQVSETLGDIIFYQIVSISMRYNTNYHLNNQLSRNYLYNYIKTSSDFSRLYYRMFPNCTTNQLSFLCYHSSFLSTISYNLLSYKFGIYFYHILIKYLGNPHSWDYYIYSILCSTVIVSLSQSDYLPRCYPSL